MTPTETAAILRQFNNWCRDPSDFPASPMLIEKAIDAAIAMIDRLEAAESDALEQARLNGMGASREAALMAKLEAAEKERYNANAAAAGIALQAETLQAERDALRAENEALATNLRGKHSITGATYAHLIAERDALRAKIEAMEKQEPVAWSATDETGTVVEALGMNRSSRFDTALYLAPGAQPAPSVPEGWKLVPIEPTPGMMRGAHRLVAAARRVLASADSQGLIRLDESGDVASELRSALEAAPEAKL